MERLTDAEERLAVLFRGMCDKDQKDLAICIGLKARKEHKVEDVVKYIEDNNVQDPDELVKFLYG